MSGFSLAAMTAFLGAMPGGQVGFEEYLKGVASRVSCPLVHRLSISLSDERSALLKYSQRASKMDSLLRSIIPEGLIQYTRPSAGMFCEFARCSLLTHPHPSR